jgi:hypothetical protein
MLQRANRRLVAVLLLVPFLQKMGMELWLHHWLHEPHQTVYVIPVLSKVGDTKTASSELALSKSFVSCHCVDDTMMPMASTEGFTYEAPLIFGPILSITAYADLHASPHLHTALRGPPSLLNI